MGKEDAVCIVEYDSAIKRMKSAICNHMGRPRGHYVKCNESLFNLRPLSGRCNHLSHFADKKTKVKSHYVTCCPRRAGLGLEPLPLTPGSSLHSPGEQKKLSVANSDWWFQGKLLQGDYLHTEL